MEQKTAEVYFSRKRTGSEQSVFIFSSALCVQIPTRATELTTVFEADTSARTRSESVSTFPRVSSAMLVLDERQQAAHEVTDQCCNFVIASERYPIFMVVAGSPISRNSNEILADFSALQIIWRREWDSKPSSNVTSTAYRATDDTIKPEKHC